MMTINNKLKEIMSRISELEPCYYDDILSFLDMKKRVKIVPDARRSTGFFSKNEKPIRENDILVSRLGIKYRVYFCKITGAWRLIEALLNPKISENFYNSDFLFEVNHVMTHATDEID